MTGSLLIAAACAANAQKLDKPLLLVASPETAGLYSNAVMVVVPKNGGHVGFIINRATPSTVASVFSEEPDSAKVHEPIYFGGPRNPQQMYAAVRRDPGEGARNIFGDLYVTVSGATVDRILRQWPNEARYFAGFAAWGPGELAEQVDDGDWLLAAADERALFHPHPESMWAELVKQIQSTF
jgi:putative transcriptional regulator